MSEPFSIGLIDFWKLKRKQQGLVCIVKEFHEMIAELYTKLMLGLLPKDNLMILMPPRCIKTGLCDTFIEWAQSYFPDSESIKSGFGKELPVESVIGIRDTLTSDWYQGMVGTDWGAHVKMVGEKGGGRQDHFRTIEGGAVKAVGVNVGIIGFGAGKLREEYGGGIFMDDLLKAQDAKSPVIRKKTYAYIGSGLKTRRNRQSKPYTPMILIQQRLGVEDPAGMLMREERDDWHIVDIPALQPDGTSIWEERISVKELEKMMVQDPEKFYAQYQQTPMAGQHVILKREYWREWKNREALERRITLKIITADTAFKAKDDNDFSVFQCWGIENTNGIHLLDQIRGRWEFPQLLMYAKAFWLKHHIYVRGRTQATEFWIEDKASGISLIQTLRGQASVPAKPWSPSDKTSEDKVGRAKQGAIPASSGRIYLPPETALQQLRWADMPKAFQLEHPMHSKEPGVVLYEDLPEIPFVRPFKDECEAFTNDDSHMYDDQVDAFTEAVCIWLERGGGVGGLPLADAA